MYTGRKSLTTHSLIMGINLKAAAKTGQQSNGFMVFILVSGLLILGAVAAEPTRGKSLFIGALGSGALIAGHSLKKGS